MLKILEDVDDKGLITVGIVELTREDWAVLILTMKEKIQKFGKIHWYFEMEDFRSVPKNIQPLDELFAQSYQNSFERIAVVGNKDWHGWMCELIKPFNSAEIRFFEMEDQSKAHTWIRDKINS